MFVIEKKNRLVVITNWNLRLIYAQNVEKSLYETYRTQKMVNFPTCIEDATQMFQTKVQPTFSCLTLVFLGMVLNLLSMK